MLWCGVVVLADPGECLQENWTRDQWIAEYEGQLDRAVREDWRDDLTDGVRRNLARLRGGEF